MAFPVSSSLRVAKSLIFFVKMGKKHKISETGLGP